MQHAAACMTQPVVVNSYLRNGGCIDTIEPANGGELYYRSCVDGCCRFSSDLWQAELHLDNLLLRQTTKS